MSLATISIVGNLAKEPERFHFSSGRYKTTLQVAVSTFNKTKQEKSTDYYRVETWDRLADLAQQYLHTGNQVAISGRLAMQKWVDREGKDRITPTVQAHQLAFPPRYRPSSSSAIDTKTGTAGGTTARSSDDPSQVEKQHSESPPEDESEEDFAQDYSDDHDEEISSVALLEGAEIEVQ